MELPHLGAQCSMPSCKQLDFLPVKCSACQKSFCAKHGSRTSHGCSASSTVRAPTDAGVVNPTPCEDGCCAPDCSQPAATTCIKCNIRVCVSHRHPPAHACGSVVADNQAKKERVAAVAQAKQHYTEAVQAAKAKRASKPLSAKAQKMAAKVALMKIKGKAIGDKSIPQDKRLYLLVFYHPADAGPKPGTPLFVSSRWASGKALDKMASKLGVPNRNNEADAPKLCLFNAATREPVPLDTGEPLCQFVASGSSLVLTTRAGIDDVPAAAYT
eukprot:m.106827 g.106827  ORF g.106827 m.106827 type:complete len:271 (-) comp15804_c0_seq1:136-948(-)